MQEEDSEGWRLHSSAVHHLNKAWEKYYVVFRNINKHLPQASIAASFVTCRLLLLLQLALLCVVSFNTIVITWLFLVLMMDVDVALCFWVVGFDHEVDQGCRKLRL